MDQRPIRSTDDYVRSCVTVKELAKLTHIPVYTINQWRRHGKIPFVRLRNRQYLYPVHALDHMLGIEVFDPTVPFGKPLMNQHEQDELHEQKRTLGKSQRQENDDTSDFSL